MEIVKTFDWIMGHRLTFHKGGCFTRHGHNYRCKITISGLNNNNGMVMDFSDLSQIFRDLVYKPLDHCFMIYQYDVLLPTMQKEQELLQKISNKKEKIVIVPFETTAENIAKYIFNKLKQIKLEVTRVKVYETPTSCAQYRGD